VLILNGVAPRQIPICLCLFICQLSIVNLSICLFVSWHWTYSKGLPKQQPKGILQYERIGTLDSNVSGVERSHPEQCSFETHWRLGFQSISLWLAPGSKIPIMSVLYTQCSLPDSKLESGEEQGPSKWDPVFWTEVKTSTIHRSIKEIFFNPIAVLSY
jgi:hypothetical protein